MRIVGQLRQAGLEQAGVPSSTADHNADGPRVLVVDDDANDRQLLAGLLQMDGCVVETANDGSEAIAFLRHGAIPDVVLLDMQMPRLDGKETLTAIRDGWGELLVFGVSGSTPAENGIAVGVPGGIDEWFEKLLNPRQLMQRMRERLGCTVNVSA